MLAVILTAVSTPEQAKTMSLETQERLAREACQQHGWDILEVLRVDGQSRSKHDNIDSITKAIPAFARLWELVAAHAFDILVIDSLDRLNRDIALFPYLVQSIIRAGAKIHSRDVGEINEANYTAVAAMALLSIRSPQMLHGHKITATKTRQLSDGLQSAGVPVTGLRFIRDHHGKRVGIEPDPAWQPVFAAAATIILEGHSWHHIERILFERHGLGRDAEHPYWQDFFYQKMSFPFFWGNASTGHTKAQRGAWIFDAGAAVPAGVTIHYGTHQPVLAGEIGERIKAIMRRRFNDRGRTRHHARIFNGLAVCAYCGHSMAYQHSGTHHGRYYDKLYLRCITKEKPQRGIVCKARMIREDIVIERMDALLRQLLAGEELSWLLQPVDAEAVGKAEAELALRERTLRNLILDKASAPDDIRNSYDTAIQETRQRIAQLQAELKHLNAPSEAVAQQNAALVRLKEVGIDRLWELPNEEIRAMLYGLLGDYRIVVRDHEFIGLAKK